MKRIDKKLDVEIKMSNGEYFKLPKDMVDEESLGNT